jgi:hypothetical protein
MEGQLEYHFGHVLVRDVCYQRLPRTERIARHVRTADWLDALSSTRLSDLAEVVAGHRYTAYEIARTLSLDAGRWAGPARDALHRAARRAYALRALETAAKQVATARTLCDDATPPLERLSLELLDAEIAFYGGGDTFLRAGGEERLTGLAERLLAAGHQPGAARAWTLLGQAAWLRADRTTALSGLDRAVELFDELPDTPEKADAYFELGRLHMLNLEDGPAIAAAGIAADIASQLGLVEVAAEARITVATARYQAGDRRGLAELQEVTDLCRRQGLLATRRACRNLSYALREEGDWTGSLAMLHESLGSVPGGHNLATGYSHEAQRAHFDGDWERLVGCAQEIMSSPSGEWDLQVRGMSAWIGLLRDEPPAEDAASDAAMTDLVAAGRRSGFHRLLWNALAHAALYHALRGRADEAALLLAELSDSWQKLRAIASGEWLHAAAHAAVLAGRSSAVRLREMLTDVPHRTPWVEAALRSAIGAIAAADGDRTRAAALHRAAADIYTEIGNVTDRMLSLAAAVRADPGDAAADEVREFAAKRGAPGLATRAGL